MKLAKRLLHLHHTTDALHAITSSAYATGRITDMCHARHVTAAINTEDAQPVTIAVTNRQEAVPAIQSAMAKQRHVHVIRDVTDTVRAIATLRVIAAIAEIKSVLDVTQVNTLKLQDVRVIRLAIATHVNTRRTTVIPTVITVM